MPEKQPDVFEEPEAAETTLVVSTAWLIVRTITTIRATPIKTLNKRLFNILISFKGKSFSADPASTMISRCGAVEICSPVAGLIHSSLGRRFAFITTLSDLSQRHIKTLVQRRTV